MMTLSKIPAASSTYELCLASNSEPERAIPSLGDEIVNTASESYASAEASNKGKWWWALLRAVLDRILNKIGDFLFEKYVWPYLVKLAKGGWALLKAAWAFVTALVAALWHQATAGAAATTTVKTVVMTCGKVGSFAVAA